MKITNSRIINNHAPQGSGGGIVNHGALELKNIAISSNESGFWGGGIFTGGSIDAFNVTINQNTAVRGGGGIYNQVDGSLILNRVTINDNHTQLFIGYDGGGGIDNIGTMELTNVTLSGNSAVGGVGGGIRNYRPSTVSLISTLTNVTLNGNQATQGGGIYNDGAATTLVLTNTIIANSPRGNNCTGKITSNGYNLDSENSCGFASPGDIINRDPHLYPLEDNGGFNQTLRLGAGSEYIKLGGISYRSVVISPVVDAGDSTSCPRTDQRGVVRPIGNGCDIGAYEFP